MLAAGVQAVMAVPEMAAAAPAHSQSHRPPTCEQNKLILQQLRQHWDVDALEGADHLAGRVIQMAEVLQSVARGWQERGTA